MPTHFTIDQDHRTIETRETGLPIVYHHILNGHDLGGGYTRYLVQMAEGDTADNPCSTKGPIYGPAFVCYDVHRSGISVQIYNDPGEFYDDIYAARQRREAMLADRMSGG